MPCRRGSTDLSAGYFRGLQEARRAASDGGTAVLLISDGHANVSIQDPGQLGDRARKAHADGTTTTTSGWASAMTSGSCPRSLGRRRQRTVR